MAFNPPSSCTGNCSQGRFCDCAQEFSDSELGIEPPPKQSKWGTLAMFLGVGVLVVLVALLISGVIEVPR